MEGQNCAKSNAHAASILLINRDIYLKYKEKLVSVAPMMDWTDGEKIAQQINYLKCIEPAM